MVNVTRPTETGGPHARGRPEAALFRKAQAGCRESLNQLMAQHDGLAQAAVRRQGLACTLSFDDLLQAARTGLWQAIRGYDPQRGCTFATYAWPCIVRQVWRAVKAHPLPSAPAAADTADGDAWTDPDPEVDVTPTLAIRDARDPADVWEARCVEAALHDLVARLPYRLYRVVRARYGLGLDGAAPARATYAQIGARWQVCGERVRQWHVEALIWLRQPAHAQTLRSLLGRHTRADYQRAETLAQAWRRRGRPASRREEARHAESG
jgi:RNA polymerase sigma factor (sigma-70 family)